MNKRVIYVLCAVVVIVAGFFLVRGMVSTNQNPNSGQAQWSNEGTYWKTVGFDGIEFESGDFWSDLFLWEDGTGYFRFSQATPSSNYYGMYDVTSCDWSMGENGVITLFNSGTKNVLYTGSVEDSILLLDYKGYLDETIRMEQAKMPPYGAHWTVLDMYGTWSMVSYTDSTSGYHLTKELDENFASEITMDQVIYNHFWLADPVNGRSEILHGMSMGYHDDNDYSWYPISEGPIWADCINQAWHVEFSLHSNYGVHYYAAYVDGKLLFKRVDAANPNSFPYNFTAEYEYVDYRGGSGMGDGLAEINTKYGLAAYAAILDDYRNMLSQRGEIDEIADYLVSALEYDAHINDATSLRELYSSIEEPLSGNSTFGYAIWDIDIDGIPELFILSEDKYADDYTINSFYTLQKGVPTLVGAYWSRKRCNIGVDGTIYINGSNSAFDSSSISYWLNGMTGKLQQKEVFRDMYQPNNSLAAAGLVFTPFTSKTTNNSSPSDYSKLDATVNIFSSINGYNGKVYSIYAAPEIPNFLGIKGSTKFTPLPEAIGRNMNSLNLYVYTFTIYRDKIYYIAGEQGSEIGPGEMYRCNLDGSKNEKILGGIADFYFYHTPIFIYDNALYYEEFTSPYVGGRKVYKINLDNLNRQEVSDFPEQTETAIHGYKGAYYYFLDRTLYKRDMQTDARTAIMTLSTTYGLICIDGDGLVIAIVDDIIYYIALGEYSENGNVYLYSISINGGKSERLASWFMP